MKPTTIDGWIHTWFLCTLSCMISCNVNILSFLNCQAVGSYFHISFIWIPSYLTWSDAVETDSFVIKQTKMSCEVLDCAFFFVAIQATFSLFLSVIQEFDSNNWSIIQLLSADIRGEYHALFFFNFISCEFCMKCKFFDIFSTFFEQFNLSNVELIKRRHLTFVQMEEQFYSVYTIRSRQYQQSQSIESFKTNYNSSFRLKWSKLR